MNAMLDRDQTGFTLIELMITVAVIAILGAIAYPSYVEHVARGRRADAKTVMLEATQVLERRFTECGAYNRKPDCAAAANMGEVIASSLQSSPKEGATKWYQMDAGNTTLAAATFTLTFLPQGAQASDKCGSFQLANTGQKSVINKPAGSTATVSDCWNR